MREIVEKARHVSAVIEAARRAALKRAEEAEAETEEAEATPRGGRG